MQKVIFNCSVMVERDGLSAMEREGCRVREREGPSACSQLLEMQYFTLVICALSGGRSFGLWVVLATVKHVYKVITILICPYLEFNVLVT